MFCWFAVGCLNNDRTVMSRPYAWRVLACLPILKGSACTKVSKEWQTQRRLSLYHSAMAPIIAEVNEICSKDAYYRFADKTVRKGRGFWHLLCMDGAEIAAASMCGTDNCPTCECPKEELDSTEDTYRLRHIEAVRSDVEKARAEHLNADGTVKERHKEKVPTSNNCLRVKIRPYSLPYNMLYDMLFAWSSSLTKNGP